MFVSLILFASQIVVFRFTIMLLYSNMRIGLKNITDVCIKFSLLVSVNHIFSNFNSCIAECAIPHLSLALTCSMGI